MSRNYYQELEIQRDASDIEIAKAYRKLSLRWHPKLCKEDEKTKNYHFSLISEAYEVLSDPVRRAFYDKYGEEKLKEGLFSQGELKGGYRFANNPEEIFTKFYGEYNAFSQIFDSKGEEEYGSLFGSQFGGQGYEGTQKPANLEVNVEITLEEIYNGCYKEVQYPRIILNKCGRTTSTVMQTKTLQIVPGTENRTVITYPGEGNESSFQKTSDLIFTIIELPHNKFQRRKQNDLVYIQQIDLVQALDPQPVEIQTLDSRRIFVPIDTIVNPKTIKKVEGEGMPVLNKQNFNIKNNQQQENTKGNLFVKFEIKFPQQIPPQQKQRIAELLE